MARLSQKQKKSIAQKMGDFLSPAWGRRRKQIANRVARKQTSAHIRALKRKIEKNPVNIKALTDDLNDSNKRMRRLNREHKKLNGKIKEVNSDGKK